MLVMCGCLAAFWEVVLHCPCPWLCSSPLCLVFQEVLPATGGAVRPEDMQCAGSTINLRDLQ